MEKKIKILFCVNSLAVGGAEKMLLDLCRLLPKDRYELAVATVMGGGPLEKAYREAGVNLYIYTKKSKLGFDVISHFKKTIKNFRPDIVHTHLLSADTWGRIAALLTGQKRIIMTEHNRNIEEGPFVKSLKHFLSYFTTKIIASSEAIKEYQIKNELIPKEKIEVIYYGIDLEKFPFRGLKTANYGDGPVKFTTVGRLTRQKGQQYLLEALAKLEEEYRDHLEISLEIAGEGERKEKLQEVAKRLHIDEKIKFLGIVDDVSMIFKETDVFVLPSLYEGLGIVLLEAMAVGVPVIASDIPAVNEIVRHRETGLLFEPENSDELTEQIVYLLKNPDEQEILIKNARKLVEDRFTVQRMVSEYDEFYKRILE